MNISEIKQAHKLLKEQKYVWKPIDKGYNNRTLYVNLDNNRIEEKPVTQWMKDKFIGGKGFGLKLLWDGTRPDTRWNDPDNAILGNRKIIGGNHFAYRFCNGQQRGGILWAVLEILRLRCD